ncbi:uncharacterized protein LOC135948430 isoform X2 [Cloeon dipterum]|uniref:uncharacterized protein LOC135948430 isoform X2 n=1 Tax=Cloeon dipterum TaxID=197152 RepID=UPI00321F8812
MSSCLEAKYHKAWWYSCNFCVECSLKALKVDPEATLNTLLFKVRQQPLRVQCTARLLAALNDVATPLTFPAHLIPRIVETMEAIVDNLRPREARNACSVLLTKCLEIAESDPPQCPRVSVITGVVSKSVVAAGRIERLLVDKPDQVVKLMYCPRVDRACRYEVLRVVLRLMKSEDLLNLLCNAVHSVIDPEQAATLLNLLCKVLTSLSSTPCVTKILQFHFPKIVQNLVRCVTSRDDNLQIYSVRFVGFLASLDDPYLSNAIVGGDPAASIGEALFFYNNAAISEVLGVLPYLCNAKNFYEDNGKARLFLENIILRIGTISSEGENDIFFNGVRVVTLLLKHSVQFKTNIVGKNASQLIHILSRCVSCSNDQMSHTACHTALHFISSAETSAETWQVDVVQLAKLVLTKDACPNETSGICKCFALKLVNGLLFWCGKLDAKGEVSLDALIFDIITDHARKCCLLTNSKTSEKLLSTVKNVLECDEWTLKTDLSATLASMGFLDLLLIKGSRNFASIETRVESVALVTRILCENKFGICLEERTCINSLMQFCQTNHSLLFTDATAEANLSFLYCRAYYNPNSDSAQFIDCIVCFLSYCFCGSISSSMAKGVLFILACQGASGILPECVIRLVCRWATVPERVYTDSPLYVNWILGLHYRQIPQEFLVSTLQLWLAENRCEKITCNAATVAIFLEVMVFSSNFQTAANAHHRLNQAIEEMEDNHSLIETVWIKLPVFLMRSSASNSDGNYGHAFHLSLAAKICMNSKSSKMPFGEAWSVLPEFIVSLLKLDKKKWTMVSLEAAFDISTHVLTLENTSQWRKLILLFRSKSFITDFESYVNSKDILASALKLLSAMIVLQNGYQYPTNSSLIPARVEIDSNILLDSLLCENQNCGKILAVLNLVNDIITLSDSSSSLASITSKDDRNLIRFCNEFFKSVHAVIALHPGTCVELAGWHCLENLLTWSKDKWLCHAPWTHTLIWMLEIPTESADASRRMLVYLRLFFLRLHESYQGMNLVSGKTIGSKAKLTNRTAQRLVCCASAFAYRHCCRSEILMVLKQIDFELEEEVRRMIKAKVIELEFSG